MFDMVKVTAECTEKHLW